MSFPPPGRVIVKREVWGERVWLEHPVSVASDDGDVPGGVLAVVLADGAPFTFDGAEPVHPWAGSDRWRGPTVLQLRRPGEWYSVWKFFGPASEGHPFLHWYLNIERPVVRTPDGRGIDTDDLELDLVVEPDGTRQWKDVDQLAARVAEGRFDVPTLLRVLETAAELTDLLDRDDRWWAGWDTWAPPTRRAGQ
jgi:hypothetical protein